MARGFTNDLDFSPAVGMELCQIQIDKYHVMLWLESGHVLLNIADRFAFRSADGKLDYVYEIYGDAKWINLDSILRQQIVAAHVFSLDWLDIEFATGDVLSIYDNPEFRSWWFLDNRETARILGESFNLPDRDVEDMTKEELRRYEARLASVPSRPPRRY